MKKKNMKKKIPQILEDVVKSDIKIISIQFVLLQIAINIKKKMSPSDFFFMFQLGNFLQTKKEPEMDLKQFVF